MPNQDLLHSPRENYVHIFQTLSYDISILLPKTTATIPT